MKKARYLSIYSGLILFFLNFTAFPGFTYEIETGATNRVELLMPGVTRTIEIIQDANFPQGLSQILVVVVGYGGVSITLRKNDTEGDLLVLTGAGISPAGIVPILKFGRTSLTLFEAVEIGDERFPFGIIWISSWINPPVPEPPANKYTLTLSAFLTF